MTIHTQFYVFNLKPFLRKFPFFLRSSREKEWPAHYSSRKQNYFLPTMSNKIWTVNKWERDLRSRNEGVSVPYYQPTYALFIYKKKKKGSQKGSRRSHSTTYYSRLFLPLPLINLEFNYGSHFQSRLHTLATPHKSQYSYIMFLTICNNPFNVFFKDFFQSHSTML